MTSKPYYGSDRLLVADGRTITEEQEINEQLVADGHTITEEQESNKQPGPSILWAVDW